MWKFILLELLIIFGQLININEGACDLSTCNYEGECKNATCQCIGDKYFTGKYCKDLVDHCSGNPCKNGGVCKNFIGYHICENCSKGYGGHNCNEKLENSTEIFTKMILHFRHYAYHGESHIFLIFVETIGQMNFSLELVAENYIITYMDIVPSKTLIVESNWQKSNDLKNVIKSNKLRYSRQLPYTKGYFHVAKQTFWNVGLQTLNLSVFDTQTMKKELFHAEYKLLVIQPSHHQVKCVPEVEFLYGNYAILPLNIDMQYFNNFEIHIKKRCFTKSKMTYQWRLFNTLGHEILFNFGETKLPQLKISSYSLWFHNYGILYLTYRLEVEVKENYGKFSTITKQRCFMYLMPKVTQALVAGGKEREVGIKQPFYLDGSQSRDFAYRKTENQNLLYKWNCSSSDDPNNEFCKNFFSTAMKTRIENGENENLLLNKTYTFHLRVQSTVYRHGYNFTFQDVTIVKQPTIPLKILCVRNCKRFEFLQGRKVHLKVVPSESSINFGLKSQNATIYWSNDKGESLSNEHRAIFAPPDTVATIYVEVEHKGQKGKADIFIRVNQPPSEGSCKVEPQKGVAFETLFNITCPNYWDPKLPLIYEFLVNNYTLARTTYCNVTDVPLPPTDKITVYIYDELWSLEIIDVDVTVEVLPNASTYLEEHKNLMEELHKNGDSRAVLILVYSLIIGMENGTGADILMNQIEDFEFQTLLNAEQLVTIGAEFCRKLLPFNSWKAYIFGKFMRLIRRVLELVVHDGEIEDLFPWVYEQTTDELIQISNEIFKPWEDLPVVERIEREIITRAHPTIESYLEMPDFDKTAIRRLNNWLSLSYEINKCLFLWGVTSSAMHSPTEEPMIYEFPPTASKNYAIDLTVVEGDFEVNETTYTVKFTPDCLTDIRYVLSTDEIAIQSIQIQNDSNPFWWYPDNYGLKTHYVYFSIFAIDRRYEQSGIIASIKPFEITMLFKKKMEIDKSKIVTSNLKSRMHMPIFMAFVPANSILIVKFINSSIDIKVLVKCGKPPRSYETIKSSFIIYSTAIEEDVEKFTTTIAPAGYRKRDVINDTDNEANVNKEYQKFMVTNYLDTPKHAYMAVLSKDRKLNIENMKTDFSFIMEIHQCVTWDFGLGDPQWNSKGCQAVIHNDTDNAIKCHCAHLSLYSGKAHAIIPAEDLRDDHILLDELPYNWPMIILYCSLLGLLLLILFYAYYTRIKYHCVVLNTNLKHDNYDVEVFLITGGQPNASSTANIILQFLTSKGSYNVIVYQPKSSLKQSTTCKFYMCSAYIDYPFKLKISHDKQGRFPSWYCKQVIINDWQKQRYHVCVIENWVSTVPIVYKSDQLLRHRYWERYRYNLSILYKSWYQFQPYLGPRIFIDVPREYRAYIWIIQLLVTILIVSYYYGPTTMKTYEEERDTYHYVRFYIWDIIWLAFLCYAINICVSMLFYFFITVQLKGE